MRESVRVCACVCVCACVLTEARGAPYLVVPFPVCEGGSACVCVFVCESERVCVCVLAKARLSLHTTLCPLCVYVYVYVCVRTHLHTHVHLHSHTHTLSLSLSLAQHTQDANAALGAALECTAGCAGSGRAVWLCTVTHCTPFPCIPSTPPQQNMQTAHRSRRPIQPGLG